MSDVKYMTFPIELLKNAFTDVRGVVSNAMDYAFYVKYKELGSIEDTKQYFGLDGFFSEVLYEPCLNNGEAVFNSFENPPLTSINVSTLYNFLLYEKEEFEIAVFCAFCGLRSIIGTKPYTKTTNEYLMARMFGFRSKDELLRCEPKPEYHQKFLSNPQKIRYQLTEKIIKNELIIDWGLNYYSNRSRGFFVSFKLDFEVLVQIAEKSRKSIIKQKHKEEQRLIIQKVIHNLSK